ncbi:hypothetical protein E3E23_09390 [Thermococcus sp. CX2]|uniref:hypothetical protein n=1 Tax=Thermococcus sp. CX2 TaxID=163006 RepID=UPI00143AA734|nr:hypothetical protein [Thermococcus sp. CX2]NJE86032.1 hypothetical protein [Thermococcus sp. CX2]
MEELITENYPECYDEIGCKQLVKLAGKSPSISECGKKNLPTQRRVKNVACFMNSLLFRIRKDFLLV